MGGGTPHAPAAPAPPATPAVPTKHTAPREQAAPSTQHPNLQPPMPATHLDLADARLAGGHQRLRLLCQRRKLRGRLGHVVALVLGQLHGCGEGELRERQVCRREAARKQQGRTAAVPPPAQLTLVRLLELLHQLGVDLLAPLIPLDRVLGLWARTRAGQGGAQVERRRGAATAAPWAQPGASALAQAPPWPWPPASARCRCRRCAGWPARACPRRWSPGRPAHPRWRPGRRAPRPRSTAAAAAPPAGREQGVGVSRAPAAVSAPALPRSQRPRSTHPARRPHGEAAEHGGCCCLAHLDPKRGR